MKTKTTLLLLILLLLCAGCGKEAGAAGEANPTDSDNTAAPGGTAAQNDESEEPNTLKLTFNEDGSYTFSGESVFFDTEQTFYVEAPANSKVYFTLDGDKPSNLTTRYTAPLILGKTSGDFPSTGILRFKCYYADGSESRIATKTYLVADNATTRFTTPVIFITGTPTDFYSYVGGMLFGTRFETRGRSSEKACTVEAYSADGQKLFIQDAGIRIYGGVSRKNSIKSFKLFSRKSYDPDHKNFKTNVFGTKSLVDDSIIKTYDKLVLRNSGNDFQFGFIRDALAMRLANESGIAEYEASLPAVVYINGYYYGYVWLQETYCDKYFKEKFGDADGEFVVLSGKETEIETDEKLEDDLTIELGNFYNLFYSYISECDLTDDAAYDELTATIDVENYLDYYAINVLISNADWPYNNFKCYRYVPSTKPGAENNNGEGVFDGRYRFLLHDIDYSFGLYENDHTLADYNTLTGLMSKSSSCYSPLFTALMKRPELREYFVNRVTELADTVFSADHVMSVYEELRASQMTELEYYYEYLSLLQQSGDLTIWTSRDQYDKQDEILREFIEKRADYIKEYVAEMN